MLLLYSTDPDSAGKSFVTVRGPCDYYNREGDGSKCDSLRGSVHRKVLDSAVTPRLMGSGLRVFRKAVESKEGGREGWPEKGD